MRNLRWLESLGGLGGLTRGPFKSQNLASGKEVRKRAKGPAASSNRAELLQKTSGHGMSTINPRSLNKEVLELQSKLHLGMRTGALLRAMRPFCLS